MKSQVYITTVLRNGDRVYFPDGEVGFMVNPKVPGTTLIYQGREYRTEEPFEEIGAIDWYFPEEEEEESGEGEEEEPEEPEATCTQCGSRYQSLHE